MSRQQALSATIHIRDFVDTVASDPARANSANHVEILTEVNVFEEDAFSSPFVVVEPIRARIRAYLPQEERTLYVPDTFFYADGRFSTALSADGVLKMSVQALSLMRHPGDVSDFDDYRSHLPERWCPMATVVGSVASPGDSSLDTHDPRHFTLESSVYDALKAAPVRFSVDCFFEDTKRWLNVKAPPPQTLLSITAKVAGRTAATNRLALRVLDLTYLPGPASAAPPTPTTTPAPKRSARWDRTGPSTPSKRPRLPSPPLGRSPERDVSPPGPTHRDPLSAPTSLSTVAVVDAASVASEHDARPHRARHPPKKYTAAD